jgi:hypothetical protein
MNRMCETVAKTTQKGRTRQAQSDVAPGFAATAKARQAPLCHEMPKVVSRPNGDKVIAVLSP